MLEGEPARDHGKDDHHSQPRRRFHGLTLRSAAFCTQFSGAHLLLPAFPDTMSPCETAFCCFWPDLLLLLARHRAGTEPGPRSPRPTLSGARRFCYFWLQSDGCRESE